MKKYTIPEMIKEARQHYRLSDNNPSNDAFRQKFLYYLRKTNGKNGKSLLENARNTEYKPGNKKEKYYFSETEMHEIIFSAEIHDYCCPLSTDEKIKDSITKKEIEEEMARERERYLKFLEDNGLPYEPYIGQALSSDEEIQELTRVMVTEIFELFFTPIDAKYITDRNIASVYGGDTANAESITAAERLKSMENYYHFNPDNPRLDAILDRLADKIAKRMKK